MVNLYTEQWKNQMINQWIKLCYVSKLAECVCFERRYFYFVWQLNYIWTFTLQKKLTFHENLVTAATTHDFVYLLSMKIDNSLFSYCTFLNMFFCDGVDFEMLKQYLEETEEHEPTWQIQYHPCRSVKYWNGRIKHNFKIDEKQEKKIDLLSVLKLLSVDSASGGRQT